MHTAETNRLPPPRSGHPSGQAEVHQEEPSSLGQQEPTLGKQTDSNPSQLSHQLPWGAVSRYACPAGSEKAHRGIQGTWRGSEPQPRHNGSVTWAGLGTLPWQRWAPQGQSPTLTQGPCPGDACSCPPGAGHAGEPTCSFIQQRYRGRQGAEDAPWLHRAAGWSCLGPG